MAMAGCLTEYEMFEVFRGETDDAAARVALQHVIDCPLCQEQWKRFVLEERLASGIRSAVQGDARGADEAPGIAEAMELPDKLSLPGFTLRGDFTEGGQARVYHGVHAASQEEVAIKVFHNSPLNEGGNIRFSRELQSLVRLRHPHVIPIRSTGEIHGHAYFVMPWVEGWPLDEYVTTHRLSREHQIDLLIKVCSALDHAHKRGVMHLDLKPSNVRIDASGEPVVLDFGLARLTSENAEIEFLGLGVAGTPAYMAPEQVRESEDVDVRADVYSFGLLMYEVVTGNRAREGMCDRSGNEVRGLELALRQPPPVRSVAPKVDRELAAIIETATAGNRADRYRTMEALLEDLRHYLVGEPIAPLRDQFFYRFRKLGWRQRAIVAGALCVLLIVGSAVWISRETQSYAVESYGRQMRFTEQIFEAKNRLLDRRIAREYGELARLFVMVGDSASAEACAARAAAARERAGTGNLDEEVRVEIPSANSVPASRPVEAEGANRN